MGLFRWVRWRNRMGTGTPVPRRSRKWRCRSRGISSQSSALSHQLSASSQPSGKTWAAARRPFLCKGLPEIVFSVKLRHLHRNPEKRRLALKPENGSEVATGTACSGRLADVVGYSCSRTASKECSDCGSELCESHTETCGICHSIFCPSCLSFHQTEHPIGHSKPASADHGVRERKRA